MILGRCTAGGCSVLTIGARCVDHDMPVTRTFTRGRPFRPSERTPAPRRPGPSMAPRRADRPRCGRPQGSQPSPERSRQMRAVVFTGVGEPLVASEIACPEPRPGRVRLAVHACGVCRTDLHIVDGELAEAEAAARARAPDRRHDRRGRRGRDALRPGQRVGVPWLGWTCGRCRHCLAGRENLCDEALFTGYDLDGGFAEAAVADERYCFPIPARLPGHRRRHRCSARA